MHDIAAMRTPQRRSTWRGRTSTGLMLLAALGALLSFVGGVTAVMTTTPAVQVAESWRTLGVLVFAGLFALLAFRPRAYPGVWELAIFHKVAVSATVAVLTGQEAVGARTIAVAEGVLAVVLIAAYVLAEAYTCWGQLARKPHRVKQADREGGREHLRALVWGRYDPISRWE